MPVVATVAYYLLLLYSLVMWGRLALDVARTFAPNWRPKGGALVLAEFVFTLTDPPIRFVRRIVPVIRFSGLAIDLSWSIVMLVIIILISVASALAV